MGLFDRGKKKSEAPPAPAPRREPDFLSPLWSQWPPAVEATPAPPPVAAAPAPVVTPAPAAPLPALPAAIIDVQIERVIETVSPAPSRPPPAPSRPPPPRSENPPPVPGPAVQVHRVRTISEPAPPPPVVTPPRSPIPPSMPRRASERAPAHTPSELMRMAMERGDWLSARAIADKVLAYDPTDLDAHACVEACEQRLRADYEARLGPKNRVLRVVVPPDWLRQMALGSRVAYVLSRIDGVSSIDSIIDVSGMPEDECIRILVDLLAEGVLEVRPPLPRISSRPPPR